MTSVALGAAALIVLRSLVRAARTLSGSGARYSSIVWAGALFFAGLAAVSFFIWRSSYRVWCPGRSLRRIASVRDARADPGIAEVKPSPDQNAAYDRVDKHIADSHVRSGCAAKIACQ